MFVEQVGGILGLIPGSDQLRSRRLKLSRVYNNFKEPEAGLNPAQVAPVFLFYMLGKTPLADAFGLFLHTSYLLLVSDFGGCTNYNWSSAGYVLVMDSVREYVLEGHSLKGFWQVWEVSYLLYVLFSLIFFLIMHFFNHDF